MVKKMNPEKLKQEIEKLVNDLQLRQNSKYPLSIEEASKYVLKVFEDKSFITVDKVRKDYDLYVTNKDVINLSLKNTSTLVLNYPSGDRLGSNLAENYTDIYFECYQKDNESNKVQKRKLYLFKNSKFVQNNEIMKNIDAIVNEQKFNKEEIIDILNHETEVPNRLLDQTPINVLMDNDISDALIKNMKKVAKYNYNEAMDQYNYGSFGGEDIKDWQKKEYKWYEENVKNLPESVKIACDIFKLNNEVFKYPQKQKDLIIEKNICQNKLKLSDKIVSTHYEDFMKELKQVAENNKEFMKNHKNFSYNDEIQFDEKYLLESVRRINSGNIEDKLKELNSKDYKNYINEIQDEQKEKEENNSLLESTTLKQDKIRDKIKESVQNITQNSPKYNNENFKNTLNEYVFKMFGLENLIFADQEKNVESKAFEAIKLDATEYDNLKYQFENLAKENEKDNLNVTMLKSEKVGLEAKLVALNPIDTIFKSKSIKMEINDLKHQIDDLTTKIDSRLGEMNNIREQIKPLEEVANLRDLLQDSKINRAEIKRCENNIRACDQYIDIYFKLNDGYKKFNNDLKTLLTNNKENLLDYANITNEIKIEIYDNIMEGNKNTEYNLSNVSYLANKSATNNLGLGADLRMVSQELEKANEVNKEQENTKQDIEIDKSDK